MEPKDELALADDDLDQEVGSKKDPIEEGVPEMIDLGGDEEFFDEVKDEVEPEIESEVEPEIESEVEPEVESEVEPEVESDFDPDFDPGVESKDVDEPPDVGEYADYGGEGDEGDGGEEQTFGGFTEEEILAARDEMDSITEGIVHVEEAAAEGVDYWLHLTRLQLENNRLFGARRSVYKAQRELQDLGASVLDLRRSLALLHRLLTAKTATDDEIELVLRRLRNAYGAAEMGDVALAAEQVESLIGDMAGGDMSTLNPFLFRTFWVGVETRWPAGGENGVLLVRILNDGDRELPAMRLAAPAPEFWRAEPTSVDLPSLPPGAYIHLKFNIIPATSYGMEISPLSRKLSIISGYAVRQGQVRCTVRVQNRSMEPLGNIIVTPWMPPSFVAPIVPLIQRLAPDEVTNIHIPMAIEYTAPGGED